MSIARLTLHDGRKTGVPAGGALIIMSCERSPPAGMPKAKTLIRYTYTGENGAIAWVRDPFKQVLTLLPMSAAGPWAHVTTPDGDDLALPNKTGIGFEELENDRGFKVMLGIPTGPVEVELAGTMKEIEALLRPAPPPPALPEGAAPAKRPPRKKAQGGGPETKK